MFVKFPAVFAKQVCTTMSAGQKILRHWQGRPVAVPKTMTCLHTSTTPHCIPTHVATITGQLVTKVGPVITTGFVQHGMALVQPGTGRNQFVLLQGTTCCGGPHKSWNRFVVKPTLN